MAKGPPGGAIFDAIELDRISELRERDLGSAHEGRSVVGLSAQESADLVGPNDTKDLSHRRDDTPRGKRRSARPLIFLEFD